MNVRAMAQRASQMFPRTASRRSIALIFGAILAAVNAPVTGLRHAEAASLLPNGRQQFFAPGSTEPCAGCKVYFYIPGTLAPKNTWQDSGKSTLNTNPVVLDSAGSAVIYGTGSYRQIFCSPTGGATCDVGGTQYWDAVTSAGIALNTSWSGTSGGSANAQTISNDEYAAEDGDLLYFVAGASNTAAMTLNVNGLGAIAVVRDSGTGPVALSGGEVVQGNVVAVTYVEATETFHIVTPTPIQAFDGPVFFNGIITPTILAADQDDWTPTGGYAQANTVRVSSTVPIDITGLTGGGAGRIVIMHNIGDEPITFVAESSASTAENRFGFADSVTLQPNNTFELQYDSLSTRWRVISPQTTLPLGYMSGCQLSNGTDATNDIDITVCAARAVNAVAGLETGAAFGKQLDVEWAARGTPASPAGMRSSATLADGTWHIFAIGGRGLDTDFLAHNATDPTTVLPTGYTWYRRIGSIIRSSGSILGFVQFGDRFLLASPPMASQGSTGTSQNLAALTAPTGINVLALLNFQSTGGVHVYVHSPDVTNLAPSLTAAPLASLANNATANWNAQIEAMTDTSAQIAYRTASDTTVRWVTLGWVDHRGKN